MTARELITGALRVVGELDHGQTPSASEADLALDVLNSMLSNWMTQHRLVFHIINRQFALTSGKGSYTMGPGGEFDCERPVKIQSAGLIYYRSGEDETIGEIRKPLELVPATQYDAIPEKAAAALEPLVLYNDNQYPLTTLRLWPVPVCQ